MDRPRVGQLRRIFSSAEGWKTRGRWTAQEDGTLKQDIQLTRTEHSSKMDSSGGRNTQERWTAQEDGTLSKMDSSGGRNTQAR